MATALPPSATGTLPCAVTGLAPDRVSVGAGSSVSSAKFSPFVEESTVYVVTPLDTTPGPLTGDWPEPGTTVTRTAPSGTRPSE